MSRRSFIVSIFLLVFGTISEASAQSPNGFMNIFNAMMGAAIVNNARVEWSKVPASQTECIEERLQQRGASIGSLIQNGIVPNDPRIAGVRFDCRTAAVTPPTASPNSDPAESPNPDTVDVGRLSETPTFDCTPARSLTARTICADRAGASADWDLITAYWARYFSIAENEREAFDKAQQDWLGSLNRKCPRASNPPQCVLASYHGRATAYRSQLAGDALAEARLTPEQHGRIQQSLAAKGLLAGSPDGEFGSITRSAIKQFKARTNGLESDFLTAAERTELLGDAPSDTCQVVDPTNTPLNIRAKPNGPIVDTFTNGSAVRVLDRQRDERGQDWFQITLPGKNNPLGWAFGEYIDCKGKVVEHVAPPPPRMETARLKEARIFLEDAKKFIGQQTTVPTIAEIAKEAASLQLAVNQFDERAAAESMQRLADFLKPVPGFTEFEKNSRRGESAQRHDNWHKQRRSPGRISSSSNPTFKPTWASRRRSPCCACAKTWITPSIPMHSRKSTKQTKPYRITSRTTPCRRPTTIALASLLQSLLLYQALFRSKMASTKKAGS
jgi:uncharacterized protein